MVDFEILVQQLRDSGWCYQQNVLSEPLVTQLADICEERTFLRAGIGNGLKHVINESIRSDSISWIDKDEHEPAIQAYFEYIAAMQKKLNEAFYLGLNGFEGHFSRYPVGSGYKPHYDCFANDKRRVITLIFYINRNWQPEDGGQLCLHLAENKRLIEPVAGSMICFISEEILHEVLPTHKTRMALTGWFIRNQAQSYNLN